jgi:FAD/FMN-containing dehydrogenase
VIVALCAFDLVDNAIAAAGAIRRMLPSVNALEIFLQAGLDQVTGRLGLPPPFRAPHAAYLLVEAAADTDPTQAVADVVNACTGVQDVAVATDPAAARALWRYREGHTEAINLLGAPHKMDVTLPAASLAAFVATVPGRVSAAAPDAQVWMFGHAGDGNVHVNVTGVASANDEAVTTAVYELVAEHRGSISAEHGIGSAKRKYLGLVRTEAEIAIYRAIKHALDPTGTLNPHVLLPEA